MKRTVAFERAPPVMAWQTVLTERSWQITYHGNDEARARREVGSSEFPVRLATTWYATIAESGADGVDVTIAVPAFAESRYGKRRLNETIAGWANAVEGDCETAADLDVDILGALRAGEE